MLLYFLLCNSESEGFCQKNFILEKKKLWKKGLVVCSACQGLASLLIKNSYSCLFFHKKVHSTLLTKCVYANECVCKGFGMTTHMDQQITWANNRVPLLCQHRSYSTTKCLWSSWYHLEMGGTTLLSEQGGGQHDTNRIWLLLPKWKMAFLHPNRGGHLTSRLDIESLTFCHQFIHRFSPSNFTSNKT